MIKIRIEEEEIELGKDIDANWINQKINRRRADGIKVCVIVIVKDGDVDMILATPTCKPSEGHGRSFRPHEKEVYDLWVQHGLNEANFNGGKLVSFLRQLKQIL